MARSDVVILTVLSTLLMGCPDDGSTTSDTETSSSTTTTTEPTSGTDGIPTTSDTGNVPPSACEEPPAPPVPTPVPNFSDPPDSGESIHLDLADAPCPKTFAKFVDLVPDTLDARIYRPSMAGMFPPGDFPLLVFTHGNGQSGNLYSEILEPLAQSGFIVVSITLDTASTPKGRRPRLLCVAEALLDGNIGWSGSGKLDGRYAFLGHSTGGLATFAAAATVLDSPEFLAGHHLSAVAAIAPNAIPAADVAELTLIGPEAPPYFVLQGTRDGDTSGGAFSSYDRVLAEVFGAHVLSLPRKALVWAYRVEHNEYGGHDLMQCPRTPKAIALANTYFRGFLRAAFFEDPDSLDLFFQSASPELTPEVSVEEFWTEFGGAPQVYGTSSQQVAPELGFRAYVIDGFENGDKSKSDGGLNVEVSQPDFYDEASANSGGFDNLHIANVGAFQWSDGDSISWDLDLDARTQLAGATSLSFRMGAAVDVVDDSMCVGVAGALPELTLLVSDVMEQYSLDLAPYGRTSLPEAGQEIECSQGNSDGCRAWDVMQTTFRIPLADLCEIDSGVALSALRKLSLRLNGPGGLLLLDDVTIHSVPGETPVGCRCPP